MLIVVGGSRISRRSAYGEADQCALGIVCAICRAFTGVGTLCVNKVDGTRDITHEQYYDHENTTFGFSNIDNDDKNRASFKHGLDGFLRYEDPEHSILAGLLFRWSNKDNENPPLNSEKQREATTGSVKPECGLYYKKLPIFLVQVRGGLIDSKVSDFRLDIANQAISVDWRALFTSYFDQYFAGLWQKEKVSARNIATDAAVFVSSELIALRMLPYH